MYDIEQNSRKLFGKGVKTLNKNDLRVIKTKKNIHVALTKLLKNKSLSQINISELCREANINRGTFYFHYEEVSDVFQEFFEEIINDLKESYYEPYRHNELLSAENVDPKTIRIFHHIKKYESFYKIVLSEEVSMKYYYMLFDEIRNMYEQDIYNKIEVNTFASSYQANAMIGLIIEWYRNGFVESADRMNVHLVNILHFKLEEKF